MYDVAIIGAGIAGCSLAYELGKYQIKAVLIEKENDVSVGTTKANSAIIHGGYDRCRVRRWRNTMSQEMHISRSCAESLIFHTNRLVH